MKINDVEIELSPDASNEILAVLNKEFFRKKRAIADSSNPTEILKLAHDLVANGYVRDELLSGEIERMDKVLGTDHLQISVKADDSGRLRTPMSNEVLLDILFRGKWHPLTSLNFLETKSEILVEELGLYNIQINLGSHSLRRKLWLVPATDED